MIRKINSQYGEISYELEIKKVKNINMHIKPNGQILVSANKYVPLEYVDKFVLSKCDLIFKAFERYKKIQETMPQNFNCKTGDKIKILGDDYSLEIVTGTSEYAQIKDNILYLHTKNYEDTEHNKKVLEKFYRQVCTKIFTELSDKLYYDIFKDLGVEKPQLKIRDMKTRWGSCFVNKNIITLNLKLVHVKKECIEYVVLHEYSHFIQPNHSKAFYRTIEKYMPDYKARKDELNKYPTY